MLGEAIKWCKKQPYLLTLGLLGAFLVAIGVFSVVILSGKKEEEMVIKKSFDSAQDKSAQDTVIMVDVGGAVEKPGVYQLAGNSRVNDALVLAGGLGASADRDWVEKNLNLAQKLVDGVKIYIPFEGETGSNKDSPRSSNLQGLPLKANININTASSAELDKLYGVGPATAQKIIANRPYGSVEELLSKKVVKSNVYEAIKDKISVY